MYVTRMDSMVFVGRAAEYESWAQRLGDVLKAQKGFQRRIVANSYGAPARYTTINRWESREAARAWIQRPDLQAFLKANPAEGLLTVTRPIEAYEIVVSVGDPAPAGYLLLVEWHLDPTPGNAAAFEQSRHKVFERRQQLGNGFVFARLGKFLGNPTKYLVGTLYTSREAAQAALALPEHQELARAYRASDYASTPPIIETFEVVQQL
jgi:heme-degrading monooxygenase HmoA